MRIRVLIADAAAFLLLISLVTSKSLRRFLPLRIAAWAIPFEAGKVHILEEYVMYRDCWHDRM